MSRKTKDLQAPAATGKRILEPEAPNDLWAQMDEIHARRQVGTLIEKPPGSFAIHDYAERYGISDSTSRCRIKRLVEAGEVECIGVGISDVKFYRIVKK